MITALELFSPRTSEMFKEVDIPNLGENQDELSNSLRIIYNWFTGFATILSEILRKKMFSILGDQEGGDRSRKK